jgi:hypothetical protein
MAMHSLLFSRDQGIIDLAGEVLKALEFEVSQCGDATEAIQRLTDTKFDLIIVDNANAASAITVLSAAKSLPSCAQSVGIVLAVSTASLGLAEGARCHMVLYRPLSADRLRNGIKSVLGLRNEGEDAREFVRATTNIPATLRGSGLDEVLVFISNLSAGGAALQLGKSVPSSSVHNIEFSVPGDDANLSSSVELVWRDIQGRAGIRFIGASTSFTESLEKWLAAHPASQRTSKASA